MAPNAVAAAARRSAMRVPWGLRSMSSNQADRHDPVIVSFARTPMGSFCGSLSSHSGPALAATAIEAALRPGGGGEQSLSDEIEEAFLGNVLSAGVGQAPARQAVLKAGLSLDIPCTTIHKVCASGMKATMLGAQAIKAGSLNTVLCGGFESMSNVPYLLPEARSGHRLGNKTAVDGLVHDGLLDSCSTNQYSNQHMGLCAELCASTYGIGREEQDEYAKESYRRASKAWEQNKFAGEVVPVHVPQRRGDPKIISEDEEFRSVSLEKLAALKPAFKRDGGTVTAANASTLNDGAAALVVMSSAKASALGLSPLARIRGYADAARAPEEFTVAPSLAVPKALKSCGLEASDVDYHEINEAFSVVALANMRLLSLDPARVNVYGGAVALGHPLGMSGARVIGSLLSVLKHEDGAIGCASICNGGGGASAIVLERLR